MGSDRLHPRGFRSLVGNVGVKVDQPDFMLVISEAPTRSAAVFTRSRFAGPSVALSREVAGAARGVVVVSGNANVATGPVGRQDALEVRERAAGLAGVSPDALLVASTGVIGVPYPMTRIRRGMDAIGGGMSALDADEAAIAIMTTDTRPKTASRRCGDAVILGIAKGVGMIEPDMATMLAFLFTDADVEQRQLRETFVSVVDSSFNALSIDSDMSTSDTAAVFANGLAGAVDPDEFATALREVSLDLVKQIARDGEGSTKLIEVRVQGARDRDQARRAAKMIVNSPLVKTAVHGADPNWGRIVMALGKLRDDFDIDPERVRVRFGALLLYPGQVTDELRSQAREMLRNPEVKIDVDLGIGEGNFTAYGCDLTEEYVRMNSSYTT